MTANHDLPLKLIAALEAHFEHNYTLSSWALKQLRSLLESGSNPYVQEPTVSIVYRGVTVTPRWCHKHGIDPSTGAPQKVHLKLGSDNKAASWSASAKVARGYFTVEDGDVRHVLLQARVQENRGVFASGPGGLYLVAGQRQTIDQEMLALWPVTVSTVKVVRLAMNFTADAVVRRFLGKSSTGVLG